MKTVLIWSEEESIEIQMPDNVIYAAKNYIRERVFDRHGGAPCGNWLHQTNDIMNKQLMWHTLSRTAGLDDVIKSVEDFLDLVNKKGFHYIKVIR